MDISTPRLIVGVIALAAVGGVVGWLWLRFLIALCEAGTTKPQRGPRWPFPSDRTQIKSVPTSEKYIRAGERAQSNQKAERQ